jgi:type II secretory pathway component PulM
VQTLQALTYTACSRPLLKLLAVASTSLGERSAFGAAVKSANRRLRQTDGAGPTLGGSRSAAFVNKVEPSFRTKSKA